MSSGAVKRETHFVPVPKRQEETSGMLARVTLSRDLQVIPYKKRATLSHT
jgi:hypothetical protein